MRSGELVGGWGSDCFPPEEAEDQTKTGRDLISAVASHKANVNSKDADGMTALHWAGLVNVNDTVRQLVELGVDPNAVDLKGRSALMLASILDTDMNEVYVIFDLLLDAGANPHLIDKSGKNVLDWLIGADQDSAGLADNMIARGVGLTSRSIFVAAEVGDEGAVSTAIGEGWSVNMMDDEGKSVLMHAHGEVAYFLIRKGANVNATDFRGRNVICRTIFDLFQGLDEIGTTRAREGMEWHYKNNVRIKIFSLIGAGANIFAKDNTGKSALDWAVQLRKKHYPLCEDIVDVIKGTT